MADISGPLSVAFTIIGAFVFIILKIFVAKLFKGWKGWIAKFAVSFVLAIFAGIAWKFCPAASVIIIFSIMIVGGLVGYGMILVAQMLPYIGNTVAFSFSIVSPFITIWIILMVIEFVLNLALTITEIVLLFVPVVGWIVDVILLVVSLLVPIIFPIIQIAVAWSAFTTQFAGLTDCVLGMGRTGPIIGSGGVSIGVK